MTIETTLGFRWWDRVDQKVVRRDYDDEDRHPVFREASRIAHLGRPEQRTWGQLYAERLPDGFSRLMRTTSHEISCARKHGQQPSRMV